jgi:hypothetical protein
MRSICVGLLLASSCLPTFAEPTQLVATIKEIRTGWNSDQFGIVTNEPIQNPGRCPTPDGYVTNSSEPGFHTYYVAAITAFVARAKIVVVIAEQGCVASRPKLIGVNVLR